MAFLRSSILEFSLFIVDLLLITGLTIFQFLAGTVKPAKATYDKVAPVIEERIERRRMSKENIDVPLDIEAPDEEKKPKSKKKKEISRKNKEKLGSCPNTGIQLG